MRASRARRASARARVAIAIAMASTVMLTAKTASAADGATCASKERHAPFARHGQKPAKGSGMTFCDAHRGSTCCGKEQTDAARVRAVHMQLNGFGERCRDAWGALECSVCDARVGVSEGVPVCAAACDGVYRACADEFFAEDGSRRLVPCRPSDTICTKLSEWIGDVRDKGKEMCEAAGWDYVAPGERWCFDGAAAKSSERAARRSGSADKAKTSKPSKKRGKKSRKASKGSKIDAGRVAMLAGGGVGLIYVLFTRALPLALQWHHRKNSVGARYAARRAAEQRSGNRAHYL